MRKSFRHQTSESAFLWARRCGKDLFRRKGGHSPYSTASVLGAKASGCATKEDYDRLFQILDALVERCARLATSILAACVIKSGAGTSSDEPVCILCNGTTFFKTYKIFARVQGYLEDVLVREKGLYYDIISRDNDITLGAAIGGLIGE